MVTPTSSEGHAVDPLMEATLAPVHSVNVFEETVESILRLVKLGLLAPGERLPSERELARRLQVSRPTVREALRSLARTGYLTTLRGRHGGTYVLDWSPEPSGESVRALVREMGEDLLDILDFRLVVETGAAALAAERSSAEDAARLRDALELLAAAPQVSFPAHERDRHDGPPEVQGDQTSSPLSYRFADRRLHLLIAEIAGSPSLTAAMTRAQMQLSDLMAATPQMEEVIRHSEQQHSEIVAAITCGDADTAYRVMREHVSGTASYLRGFLQ